MKKIMIILSLMLLVTGCTNVKDLSYDDVIQNISVKSQNVNKYRTGYKYYLPRNMKVSNSTLYNETIEDAYHEYYLYVDVVSYYKKVQNSYKENNRAIYSKGLSYGDKYGYLEINLLENNKYLVEIMYNYAKIEVIVDKENSNEAVLSAINILKSIEYNDSIIANLLGDDVLNFSEEEIDIFNVKGKNDNYIVNDGDFEPVEDQVPDLDLIN